MDGVAAPQAAASNPKAIVRTKARIGVLRATRGIGMAAMLRLRQPGSRARAAAPAERTCYRSVRLRCRQGRACASRPAEGKTGETGETSKDAGG
jgi:hypothetical protein